MSSFNSRREDMAHPLIGLRIDPEITKRMKIRAIEESRTVNEITEELWRRYLGIEERDEALDGTGSRRRSQMLKKDSVPADDARNRAEVHEDGTGRRDKIRGKMDRRVRRGTVRRQK